MGVDHQGRSADQGALPRRALIARLRRAMAAGADAKERRRPSGAENEGSRALLDLARRAHARGARRQRRVVGHVDELAMVIGSLPAKDPRRVRPLMRRWSNDTDRWKRRVSIICQLRFKRQTDLALLYADIEPNLGDRDFFIRKAIGRARRKYAWTDPEKVKRYVVAHAEMSGLSRREALKNIG